LRDQQIFVNPIIIDPFPTSYFPLNNIQRLYHYNNEENLIRILEAYNPPFIYSNSASLLFRNPDRFRKYLHKTFFHFHEAIEDIELEQLKKIKKEKIFVVSQEIERDLRDFGCENIRVFHPFISPSRLAKIKEQSQREIYLKNATREWTADRPLVGMAGSLSTRKGFSLFYETARRNPDVDFVWVGGGQNWLVRAAKLYEKQFVELPNFFHVESNSNPHKYLAKIDTLFLSSVREPFSLVVLEALLFGKNVIVLKERILFDHGPIGLKNFTSIETTGASEETIIEGTTVESSPVSDESPEFEHCVCVVEMDQSHGFTEGVIVRIVNDWSVDGIDNEITIEVPVQVIDEHSFRFTTTNKTFSGLSSVFVYGTKVDDFHAVDKAKIFMPLIGAVQELSTKNDEKTTIISEQATRITTLETTLASVLARLDALETKS
jgi:hypothetical protein